MKNRSFLREVIMKVLYQVFILEESGLDFDIDSLIKEQLDVDNDFVTTSVNDIIKNRKDIFDLANKYLTGWKINRLGNTDQAILRMGIYELMYTKTPEIVTINEAV